VDAASYYTVVEHCMRWIVIVAILIAATDQSMKEYVLHTQKERKKIYMQSSSRYFDSCLVLLSNVQH